MIFFSINRLSYLQQSCRILLKCLCSIETFNHHFHHHHLSKWHSWESFYAEEGSHDLQKRNFFNVNMHRA